MKKVDYHKIDISKIAVTNANDYLDEKYGDKEVLTRKEFENRALLWYWLEIINDPQTSIEERRQAEIKMNELKEKDPDGYQTALQQINQEKKEELETLTIREKLERITPFISFTYISRNYFKKPRTWFVQRLNGNSEQFTQEEIQTLNIALKDISTKINSIIL